MGEHFFMSCQYVFWGVLVSSLFGVLRFFAILSFILALLLEELRFSSFGCLFFVVSFHLCLTVSSFLLFDFCEFTLCLIKL